MNGSTVRLIVQLKLPSKLINRKPFQSLHMKKIEAIVRFSRFEDITEALEKNGILFFNYFEVNGHGKQKGDTVTYRGAVYDSGDIPRLKMEVIVPDDKVDNVIDTILAEGRSGSIGDGKIIVTAVEQFIRIRTGERGNAAL